MITFVIDVYKQVWDKEGLGPEKDIHLQTLTYSLNKTIQEFSKDIHKVLGYGLGDGYSVELNEFESIVYGRVKIIDRDRYSFITKYLESNGKEVAYPNASRRKSEVLIEVYDYDEKISEELIHGLHSKFGNQILATRTERIFEKGASNWGIDLLLWVGAGIPSSIIASYVHDYFKAKQSRNVDKVNVIEDFSEEIMEYASKLSEVNKNDLTLINFFYVESDEKTHYFITSRYVDIKLILNSSNEVIEYSLDKKTQLHI